MAELKCSFCGFSFDREDGRGSCAGCPMNRFCQKVKCPNCGFELAVPRQKAKRRATQGV
ncbi:MAG: hypothetical protein ACOX2S_08960 [bacterium]